MRATFATSPPTSLEIGFIAIERLLHGDGLAVIAVGTASGNRARTPLGLPKIENSAPVGIFKIIRSGDDLGPIAAFAVGDTRHPSAGRLIAAIPQADAQTDFDE
jgi:hypothetical protein